jgi:hypothetical protein
LVNLSGTGVAPGITFAPTTLSFGNQNLNTASAAQSITLTNSGTAALNITSIVASAQYAQTNTCGASVAAGGNCSISVTFTPTATGSQPGTITVTDNATGNPQTVALSGTGVAAGVSLSPTSLVFAGQLINTTSAAQTITLTNTGTSVLNITSITPSGDYAQTNSCGISVAAGANCAINVTFTPTATGTRTGAITVVDDAAGSPQSVTLSGTGTAPVVSLSATSLSFGSHLVNTTSVAKSVTLRNTGTASLSITSIVSSGQFAQTNNCGITVAAGGSCTISVTFTPTTAGLQTGAITISDSAANSPQTITLSGTGTIPIVSLSTTSLTFASQTVGTTSAAQTVTMTNTGTAALKSIVITASGPFSRTDTCKSSLAIGSSCQISVTFTPTAIGTQAGAITITDTAADSPQTINLTGTGM